MVENWRDKENKKKAGEVYCSESSEESSGGDEEEEETYEPDRNEQEFYNCFLKKKIYYFQFHLHQLNHLQLNHHQLNLHQHMQ